MSKEIKNKSASIHDRLLNKARKKGTPSNEVFLEYIAERFLYRLSQTKHKESMILKGGWSLKILDKPSIRYTKDIDFLGMTSNSVDNIRNIFNDICSVFCNDCISFPLDRISINKNMLQNDYDGCSVEVIALFGEKSNYKLTFDIGFGDVVFPLPKEHKIASALDFESFSLLSYPPETVIAEKFDAMLYHGRANSRTKDFFDIWFLSNNLEFNGEILRESISRTMNKRGRAIPEDIIFYDEEFIKSNSQRWKKFIQNMGIQTEFSHAVSRLSTFLMPILNAIRTKSDFEKKWNTAGYWE